MTDLPDFGDEDSQRIRTEVAKGPSSDPARDLAALSAAFIVHESQDRKRHRQNMAAWSFVVALALGVAGWAWTAQANSGADRATLQDMHDRMVRIEGLLMERSERP